MQSLKQEKTKTRRANSSADGRFPLPAASTDVVQELEWRGKAAEVQSSTTRRAALLAGNDIPPRCPLTPLSTRILSALFPPSQTGDKNETSQLFPQHQLQGLRQKPKREAPAQLGAAARSPGEGGWQTGFSPGSRSCTDSELVLFAFSSPNSSSTDYLSCSA